MTLLASPLLASHLLLADSNRWSGSHWWPVFPILWLLVIGGVIWFVIAGRRRRFQVAGTLHGESRLAERFAAGEVDEQEYRERLAVLREKR